MFNGFLAGLDGQQPFTDDDYVKFVDGKPRADGVRSFLSSRSIDLPDGDADDDAAAVGHDRLGQTLQRPVDDLHNLFRVASLNEIGMAGQVNEKNGRQCPTRLVCRRLQRGKLGAQRGDSGIDDSVVDLPPQAFLNGDGLLELLPVGQ